MNSMQNISNSNYHLGKTFAEHSFKTIHVNRSNPPSLSGSAISRILFVNVKYLVSKQSWSQGCLLFLKLFIWKSSVCSVFSVVKYFLTNNNQQSTKLIWQ